jgi:hypothetical protein
MTSSLESQLADELRQEAERVGDLPGLAERVVARAHVVRRRRGLAAAAVSGVAVVVLFLAFVGGGMPHTSTIPPAHKTPKPSPAAAILSEGLRQLPQGGPPDVDYVVGTSAHLDGATITLPSEWTVASLVQAGDRWVVVAELRDTGESVVATLTKQGDVVVLGHGAYRGLAVDPSGRYVAWGSASSDAAPKYQLIEYDLTTSSVATRRTLVRPAAVLGWAKEGVIATYLVDPGGSPVVWDPTTDTLTKVWGGSGPGPTFLAYSRSRHLWALTEQKSGCGVILSRVGGTAPAVHCTDGSQYPAAFFAQDQLLAVTSADVVRILDRQLADTGDAHPVPAGTVPMQIVPTTGVHLLVVVSDNSDGSAHVLGCVGNGPCERSLDTAPGEQVVLASS